MSEHEFYDAALAEVFPVHSSVNLRGELEIGGCSVVELARTFGTPAYVVDEEGLREQMRRYRDGMSARWPGGAVTFASKSMPVLATYAIAASEGIGVDVAGAGELLLALEAGVPPETMYLHGNAKSVEELRLAVECGVGTIVVDNLADIERLERLLTRKQSVLIRVIPGIDPNTHRSVATGGNDSKFGLPIDQARALIARLEGHPTIEVEGVHLHIGSQILDVEPFRRAVEAIAGFGAFRTYNIGGGLGVNYNVGHRAPTVEEYLDEITSIAREVLPAGSRLLIEPGRSLVARAGVTIYEVNNVKTTGKTFVAVNGGLADQMNVALTDTTFSAVVANRAGERPNMTAQLVGRQCESGDLLVDGARLADPAVGDIIALGATGAYGYTLANNYNGALKPPVVFCRDGDTRLAVRRETYEDYLSTHTPARSVPWADAAVAAHETPARIVAWGA